MIFIDLFEVEPESSEEEVREGDPWSKRSDLPQIRAHVLGNRVMLQVNGMKTQVGARNYQLGVVAGDKH